MKLKIFSLYALVLTLLGALATSCSNDDIPVAQPAVFKVDPSTVISSYEEYNVGDLTSLGSNYQLRVRLLVFNENGVLVGSDEAFSADYTHIQTFNFNLVEGDYTTVAITDVVGKTSSAVSEYYTLSGQEKLTTTTLTYTGYVGGARAILGLTTEHQTITSSSHDINIKVKPSGALIVCHLDDWNACLNYSYNGVAIDVETFELLGNQASSDLTLNSYGEPDYSVKSSSEYSYIWYTHKRNSQYVGGYGYCFKFPMKNVKLQWFAETSSNIHTWGESAVVDIEAGKEYYFELDVANDEAGWYDLNLNAQAPAKLQKFNERTERMTDFNLPIENEPVSIKGISYLKQK